MDVAQEDGDGAGEGGEPREEEALGRRVVVPLVRQPSGEHVELDVELKTRLGHHLLR